MAVVFIYVARASSSVAIVGEFSTAWALATIFVGLSDYGASTLLVREVNAGNVSLQDARSKLATKALILSAPLLFAACAASSVGAEIVAAACFISTGYVASQTAQTYFRATNAAQVAALIMILDRTTLIILVIPAVGAWGALYGVSISCLIAGALPLATVVGIQFSRGARAGLAWPWTGVGHLGAVQSAGVAMALDLPLLGALAGSAAAGTYGAVNRWVSPSMTLIGVYTNTALPLLVRGTTIKQLLRESWHLPVAALSMCVALGAVAEPLATHLLGSNFAASARPLQVLCAGAFLSIVGQLGSTFLVARGRDGALAFILIAGAVLQFGLLILIAPRSGAIGASIAYTANQIFTGLLTWAVLTAGAKTSGTMGKDMP